MPLWWSKINFNGLVIWLSSFLFLFHPTLPESSCRAPVGLLLVVLPTQPSKGWDYRFKLPYLTFSVVCSKLDTREYDSWTMENWWNIVWEKKRHDANFKSIKFLQKLIIGVRILTVKLGLSSVAECSPNLCKALDLTPNGGRGKREREEGWEREGENIRKQWMNSGARW